MLPLMPLDEFAGFGQSGTRHEAMPRYRFDLLIVVCQFLDFGRENSWIQSIGQRNGMVPDDEIQFLLNPLRYRRHRPHRLIRLWKRDHLRYG